MQDGAELQKAELNRIGRMNVKDASMAATKRSCMIQEHGSTQARSFCLGVDFREEGKPEYSEKNPQVNVEID